MKLPTDYFISAIEDQKIYYFSSSKLNVTDPHYFICIKRTVNDILILSCCTSQFETVQNYVTTKKLPYETLVWINPDSSDLNNPFTKDTYINCNQFFTYTVEEFRNMYDSEQVSYSGILSDNHYVQILTGIHSSPLIDEETKEIIPSPELF